MVCWGRIAGERSEDLTSELLDERSSIDTGIVVCVEQRRCLNEIDWTIMKTCFPASIVVHVFDQQAGLVPQSKSQDISREDLPLICISRLEMVFQKGNN